MSQANLRYLADDTDDTQRFEEMSVEERTFLIASLFDEWWRELVRSDN